MTVSECQNCGERFDTEDWVAQFTHALHEHGTEPEIAFKLVEDPECDHCTLDEEVPQ